LARHQERRRHGSRQPDGLFPADRRDGLYRLSAAGLFAVEIVVLALLLTIPFVVALAIGAYIFRGASDLLFRRIAYLIIAIAALVSLPLFDGLVH
jgi:hypothetical protein